MTTPHTPHPEVPSGLLELPAGTDVWDLHAAGCWVLIPTNTCRKADGTAVMGAGLALSAAQRFPDLGTRYGAALAAKSTHVAFSDHRLLLSPTKNDWRKPSTMALVQAALSAVAAWCAANPGQRVAVAAPGCGRGGLAWAPVRAAAVAALNGSSVTLIPPMPAKSRAA